MYRNKTLVSSPFILFANSLPDSFVYFFNAEPSHPLSM